MLGKAFSILRPAPTVLKKGEEKVLGYDKDNQEEHKKHLEAQAVLERTKQKGYRQPSKKEVERAKEALHEYRRKKAETFLEEYKGRIKYYGLEIQAYFETLQNGLIKPSLTLADFNPFKELAPVKAWSEALEENLATRINCQHELNEDETVCKKCGLNPENWGANNEGVTDDYQDKQRAKIEEQKARELKCEAGEHELNKEALQDAKAPAFCVHCRKPKSEWSEDGEGKKEQAP